VNIQQSNINHAPILWAAVSLTLIAALSYILVALDVLGVGDLQQGEKPAGIIYVAAGCYLLGGLLILLRNRGLLLFGAFVNAVLLSPGGLVSKVAQILLEVALIYVIAVNWKKTSR
jgi:hypothetical protein